MGGFAKERGSGDSARVSVVLQKERSHIARRYNALTRNVAITIRVTFSLTAARATPVRRAMTSYFLPQISPDPLRPPPRRLLTGDREQWLLPGGPTHRSRPAAVSFSKLNIHIEVRLQYCACGFGFVLSALTSPEMHCSSAQTAWRNCLRPSIALRVWAATSHSGCRVPLSRDESEDRSGEMRDCGKGRVSVLGHQPDPFP